MKSLFIAILMVLAALPLRAQGYPQSPTTLQFENAGVPFFTTMGFVPLNFQSGCTASNTAGTVNINCTGGGGGTSGQLTQPLVGCGVEWTGSGYIFTVGACQYLIYGAQYSSTLQQVTLAAPDGTLDRIDVIAVDNTGSVVVIQGTLSATPVTPSTDPTSQLQIGSVYVTHGTTTPSLVTRESIYIDNTQWTGTRSPATNPPWVLNSSNNPYTNASAVDIEATTAASGNFVSYVKPAAGTVDLGTDTNFLLYIRSKATWPSTRSLVLQWYNGSTARCSSIILKDGLYGYSSSNTTSYQQINIPAAQFNCAGIPLTTLRITVSGTGATIGFYLADILVQGFPGSTSGAVTSVTGTSPVASSGGTTPAISINANGITATQLAAQYSKGSCTEVWGGSGASNAMASGDDAIVNNSCYNDSAVTRTITAVKCRSDNAANTTVLTPTFGSAGTGTAILTGTVTCGNSYAYSATGTLTNTAWTTGTGIDPGMSTVGNATSVALIVEYTY